ncbi:MULTISPECIES: S1 family peptidase [Sporomusa]|uniref:S1 family peptidase n=1 Tax=Sporomusa TaxID=2375 RepID=UPI00202F498E|nr:S1 family peptidase [Sporomusa sphaeroides]MCM0757183.1 S1 family peptidase [Sporomusa sphaeroides DSM 2875]
MNKLDIPVLFRELFKSHNLQDNLVGVGQGHKFIRGENTGKEALTILVRKKYPKSDLQRNAILPKIMAGVATDIIEVGEIRLLNQRTGFCRPAQPGISLGHYKISAGTFGAVVKDKITGEPLILSNNHVLANITNGIDKRASIGDPIIQPGTYDGGKVADSIIAHLRHFVPIYREKSCPQCRIARTFEVLLNHCLRIVRPNYQVQLMRNSEKLNLVDCAVAAPLNAEDISAEILEFGLIAGIKQPTLGLAIKKSGRTTGITHSQIIATDVTLKVGMNNYEYGVFTDQILAGPMSMPGDSGALILTDDNYAVGLLFAGSEQATMLNKIEHVLEALNVTF